MKYNLIADGFKVCALYGIWMASLLVLKALYNILAILQTEGGG